MGGAPSALDVGGSLLLLSAPHGAPGAGARPAGACQGRAGGPAAAADSGGESLGSERLAERLGQLRSGWPHAVAFLIGSDLGLDPRVLQRARWRLALGPLTLSHELARLVLYEQLFRVLSIEAGMSYHREPP